MPLFKDDKDYEIIREGEETILRIDYDKYDLPPSIEDSGICMSNTIDLLTEVSSVSRIVFYQKRDYEYGFVQTRMLVQMAEVFKKIIRSGLINLKSFSLPGFQRNANEWYAQLQDIIFRLMKSDPVGAYVELKRIMRRETILIEKSMDQNYIRAVKQYIYVLNFIIKLFEKTDLIEAAKPYVAGHKIGDRDVYRKIFAPIIKPDFMFTKLMSTYPNDAEELDSYTVGSTEITIFELPNTTQYLYHMLPPEFKMQEEKYELLDVARKILAEHKPRKSEFVDPERMREVFFQCWKRSS
jgi:hypothetical protein